jgi:hypothetical protein
MLEAVAYGESQCTIVVVWCRRLRQAAERVAQVACHRAHQGFGRQAGALVVGRGGRRFGP